MNKTYKHTLKVSTLFSLCVFILLTFTIIIGFVVISVLYRLNIINNPSPQIILIWFAVISIIIGFVLSHITDKRVLSSIIELNEAAKKVAKGNFSVSINENFIAEEIHTMAHNFNIMTRELANTEVFRSDFINNVSHEFKTPLSAIEGYATLLQSQNITEERRQVYISKIIYNTKRLSNLTENILQLSRLESQEIPIAKNNYSLDEQIRETILLFQQDWDNKKIDLDIELETVIYNGNPELLGQVWQNLLENAIKFTEPNGIIEVHMYSEKNNITVTVSDNGPGMDEQTKQRVFEKFYQGNTSHSTEGNGLGLTLVKRIVELHNGEITVSSQLGNGTEFTVKLPYDNN